MRDRNDLVSATIRGCAKGVALAAVLALFANVVSLLPPLFAIVVCDQVIAGRNLDALTTLGIAAAAGLLFLAVFEALRARVFGIIGDRLVHRLGRVVFDAAVGERLRSGSPVAAGAMRDLQGLRQFVAGGALGMPCDIAFAPVLLAILFYLHAAYAAVGATGLVLLVLIGVVGGRLARPMPGVAAGAGPTPCAAAEAAIRHGDVVDAMGMGAEFVHRWRVALVRPTVPPTALTGTLRLGAQVAMLATGAALVIGQTASVGSMVAALMLAERLLAPVERLIGGWSAWVDAIGAARRLRALHRADGSRAVRIRVPPAGTQARFAVEDVGFTPAGCDQPVLKAIDFTLEAGDVLGVIGPSGCGKSTLARLLVGLLPPSEGGIFFDGHAVSAWERGSFGAHVGFLPQHPVLLDGTVRENIARFGDADLAEVVAAARRAGVHDIIGRLPHGYETPVGECGFVLSRGIRQRIALARALFGSPVLLVLDEPAANMDGAGEQALMRAIREARKGGAIVVIAADRIDAIGVADKVLVLRNGAVEHFGPWSDAVRAIAARNVGRAAAPKVARLPVRQAPLRM
jgi:ABC-type protease/lipase transport system, ATPase and permease components